MKKKFIKTMTITALATTVAIHSPAKAMERIEFPSEFMKGCFFGSAITLGFVGLGATLYSFLKPKEIDIAEKSKKEFLEGIQPTIDPLTIALENFSAQQTRLLEQQARLLEQQGRILVLLSSKQNPHRRVASSGELFNVTNVHVKKRFSHFQHHGRAASTPDLPSINISENSDAFCFTLPNSSLAESSSNLPFDDAASHQESAGVEQPLISPTIDKEDLQVQEKGKEKEKEENPTNPVLFDEEGEEKAPIIVAPQTESPRKVLVDETDVDQGPSEPQALSTYQQAIFEAGMKDKVSPQIWKYLAGEDKQNLAMSLKMAIEELDKNLLAAPDAVVKIGFITTSKFKLAIGKTRLNKFYEY